MINRIIEFSMKNRWLILAVYAALAVWGYWALLHTPIDAIPDLSENQVIIFTEWQGRSPQEVEDQITYPLTVPPARIWPCAQWPRREPLSNQHTTESDRRAASRAGRHSRFCPHCQKLQKDQWCSP